MALWHFFFPIILRCENVSKSVDGIQSEIRIWPLRHLKIHRTYYRKIPFLPLANQNSMCSYLTVKFWVFLTFRFHTYFPHHLTVRKMIFCLLFWHMKVLSITREFWLSLFFPFVRNLNLIAKKFTYVWEKLLPSIWCSFLRKLMNGVFLKKKPDTLIEEVTKSFLISVLIRNISLSFSQKIHRRRH